MKIQNSEEPSLAGCLIIDVDVHFLKKDLRVYVIPIAKFNQGIDPTWPLLFLEENRTIEIVLYSSSFSAVTHLLFAK